MAKAIVEVVKYEGIVTSDIPVGSYRVLELPMGDGDGSGGSAFEYLICRNTTVAKVNVLLANLKSSNSNNIDNAVSSLNNGTIKVTPDNTDIIRITNTAAGAAAAGAAAARAYKVILKSGDILISPNVRVGTCLAMGFEELEDAPIANIQTDLTAILPTLTSAITQAVTTAMGNIATSGTSSRLIDDIYAKGGTNRSLAYIDFSNKDLSGANLDHANLTSANLTSATLNNVNLTSAILTSANLTSASLTSASLNGANLDHANLTNATINGAPITKAQLAALGAFNTSTVIGIN